MCRRTALYFVSSLLFLWAITTQAYAARQSVEFAPFACVPGHAPVVVEEGATYLNLRLVNVVNNLNKPWFAEGSSTVSIFIEFWPLGEAYPLKWNFARVLDSVGNSLSGVAQNVVIGPRRMPLPKQTGGASPTLKVHILEIDRTKALQPYIDGLSKAVMTIPNPASSIAPAALKTISDLYGRLFAFWLEHNKEHIELSAVGLEIASKAPTDCADLAGYPLLGKEGAPKIRTV